MAQPRPVSGAIPETTINTLIYPLPQISLVVWVLTTNARSTIVITWSSSTLLIVLLSQRRKSLLLGHSVDVRSDDESNDVEERNPGLLWKELLGEGERDWRSNPGNLHDGEETGAPGGLHLVEGASAGDDGHHAEVYGVLDWCNLCLFSHLRKILTHRLYSRISC